MKYFIFFLLVVGLCACQTAGQHVFQSNDSKFVSAEEMYNGCVKSYGLNELLNGASPMEATDTALNLCKSDFSAMRREHARVASKLGEKPTTVSTNIYNPKARAIIKNFYVNYFSKLAKDL